MIIATLLYALAAILLLAGKAWYEADSRRLEAPVEGSYQSTESWAHDLEVSLRGTTERCEELLMAHGIIPDPWLPLLNFNLNEGTVRCTRVARHNTATV